MRTWTIATALGLALGLLVGCERKPPPEKPTVWDPELDGRQGPPIYTVESDPRLIADQRKISDQILDERTRRGAGQTPPATRPAPAPPGPTPPGPTPPEPTPPGPATP